jgi:hypothetical protein
VQNARAMQVIDCRHYLSDILPSLGFLESLTGTNLRHQVTSAAVFHHQVESVLGFHDVKQLNDVTMPYPLQQSSLAAHVATHVLVSAGFSLVNDLDSNLQVTLTLSIL